MRSADPSLVIDSRHDPRYSEQRKEDSYHEPDYREYRARGNRSQGIGEASDFDTLTAEMSLTSQYYATQLPMSSQQSESTIIDGYNTAERSQPSQVEDDAFSTEMSQQCATQLINNTDPYLNNGEF